MAHSFARCPLQIAIICYIILFHNVYGEDNKVHTSMNCGELSFVPNLVLILMYWLIVFISGYFYGRHRGEYIRETKFYHKMWMWFMSYLLLYIITISWIYYNFFHEDVDINYIGTHFPWLTLYGVSYICYSIISTFTFAYHSHYDNQALIQFVCLLCTVFPLGLAILTFFLFQRSSDIANYEFGLFHTNKKIPICFNIDILSLILSCLLIIAFCHHIYVLIRVFYSFIMDKKDYLSHPNAYRGRTSNLSKSTTANIRRNEYVYKSEESESEQEIEINVQVPIYRHQRQQYNKQQLDIPATNINHDDDDDVIIQLNHSVDVNRAFTGSVSYDL